MSEGQGQAVGSAAWLGAGLAALFFLPLVQALQSNRAFLLWQPRHTLEFAVAFAALALLFAAVLYLTDRFLAPGRMQLGLLVLLSAIPLASAGAAIARQFSNQIDVVRAIPRAGLAALTTAAVIVVVWVVIQFPARTLRVMRATLLALSPASLIVLVVLVRLIGEASSAAPAAPSSRGASGAAAHDRRDGRGGSVYVFLFDELSYRFVYRDGGVRGDLPNLRRLSETSTSYLAATSPGDRTLTSLPGLLAARDMADVRVIGDAALEMLPNGGSVPLDLRAPGSLFERARASGRKTEMIGYYLPYCRLLAGAADACVSYSWYNYSTLTRRFSPFGPVLTNIILWPYQLPFGVLKVPALSALQRHIVDLTLAAATGNLRDGPPRFRFVHFSIPHLPFVFDKDGYHPAADPMATSPANYEQQLQYTDTLVGLLIDRLGAAGAWDASTVVVLSDHEFRWPPRPKLESMHVPLIVKHPGQRAPQAIADPVRASRVLEDLLAMPAAGGAEHAGTR